MTAAESPRRRSPLRARTRLVGGAGLVGLGVGGAVFVGLLVAGGPTFASRKTFAVGALLFGFGLLGWSGSILAGDGFEAMQELLDVRTRWTETASRRAMARIIGLGAGWMLGSSAATALLG